MELKDKVVIVTGAAQGLGRQFALDCVANGMKVALADIDLDALEKTRKECEGKGVEAHGYELNVTEEFVTACFNTFDFTLRTGFFHCSRINISKCDFHSVCCTIQCKLTSQTLGRQFALD